VGGRGSDSHRTLRICASTCAGEDNGIDHNKNWLRFPYDSTFLRSHYLHPHPSVGSTAGCWLLMSLLIARRGEEASAAESS
jgi:hypothetical protein